LFALSCFGGTSDAAGNGAFNHTIASVPSASPILVLIVPATKPIPPALVRKYSDVSTRFPYTADNPVTLGHCNTARVPPAATALLANPMKPEWSASVALAPYTLSTSSPRDNTPNLSGCLLVRASPAT